MLTNNKKTAEDFVEIIWNQNQFDQIGNYLHEGFIDHSLPTGLPSTKEGLTLWIKVTGKSFRHKTIIEEIICEGNKVMMKIKMQLQHIGEWRGIKPTHAEIYTVGYRFLEFESQKIIAHWGLIDGNAIENQLTKAEHGCKIQE